jgi:hypothetical protein
MTGPQKALLLLLPLCASLGACTTLQNFGSDALGTIDRIFGPPAEVGAAYEQADTECKQGNSNMPASADTYSSCMRSKGQTPR